MPAADGLELRGCDPATGLGGTLLLTRAGTADRASMPTRRRPRSTPGGAGVRAAATPLTLYSAHNAIAFYTWSDEECCLPRGATRAFLRDDEPTALRLRAGDVLVFEETLGSTNGRARMPIASTPCA